MSQNDAQIAGDTRATVRSQAFLRELPTPHKLETSTNDLMRDGLAQIADPSRDGVELS